MKKNFTQPFTSEPTTAFIFMQDNVSGNVLLLYTYDNDEENGGYYEEEACSLPYLDLDERSNVAQQLVKFVHSYGCSLSSFRELIRETDLAYSYVDDTPGTQRDTVCILARVDIGENSFSNFAIAFLPLRKFADCLRESTMEDTVIDVALTRLLMENESVSGN